MMLPDARVFAMMLSALFTAQPLAAQSCGDQEAELRTIKLERWPGYYRSQDIDGLRRFLADDFVLIDSRGQVSTKFEELEWLTANPWQSDHFEYRIRSVTCPAPNLAIIIGEGQSIRSRNGVRERHTYVSSNSLVRSPDGWQATLSHISGENTEPADQEH
jgi:hypothetical protein